MTKPLLIDGAFPLAGNGGPDDRPATIGADDPFDSDRLFLLRALVKNCQSFVFKINMIAALVKVDDDPFRLRRLQQNHVECGTGDRIDHLCGFVAVGLQLQRTIEPMDHAAPHGDQQFIDVIHQTEPVEGIYPAIGQRQIDRPAGRQINGPHIGPAFEQGDLEPAARQKNAHQGADRSGPDDRNGPVTTHYLSSRDFRMVTKR